MLGHVDDVARAVGLGGRRAAERRPRAREAAAPAFLIARLPRGVAAHTYTTPSPICSLGAAANSARHFKRGRRFYVAASFLVRAFQYSQLVPPTPLSLLLPSLAPSL